MRRSKHIIAVVILIIISTIALDALFLFMFQRPTPASSQAAIIDNFTNIHFALQAFLFSLIMVLVLYSVFVFRLKDGEEDEYGTHVEGHTALEIIWTILPVIVVILFGIYAIFILNEILAPQPDEVTVNVNARQWSWSFSYPELDGKGSDELVLLVNQPVVLEMQTEDVIHNFWVPEFRVKQDLLPGSVEVLRFTPTEVGEYKVRCAEICGLQHSTMRAPVRVVDQATWDAFQEEMLAQPNIGELTQVERGALWAQEFGCQGCHSVDGSPGAGPTWLGVYGREETMTDGSTITVDEAYLKESMLDPNKLIVEGFNPNVMPNNFAERFAEREAEVMQTEGLEISIADDLIEYIKTLSEDTNAN
ncbi:MAG TPA: cytochrome c oxidase subunit II [Anaerolineae bacterium]|nr:cytochrome c oxidase subunit II [Anaerolineae bacterium]